MKNRYLSALLSSTLSIAPMIVIVIILSFIPLANRVSFNSDDYLLLIIGMFVLIFGLALFQIGASSSLSKVGEYMGASLSKQKSLFIIILFSLSLGALITCAEPSILIVTKQLGLTSFFDKFLLIGCIALGVGAFVVAGVLRVIFHRSLKLWYLLFYAMTFMLLVLIFVMPDSTKANFLPFIFDSGGVTTGSATVPFILALGAGVAAVRGGKNSKNDSFGLVGMASVGPILTMTIYVLLGRVNANYTASSDDNLSIFFKFLYALIPHNGSNGSILDVIIALAPILVIFFIYDFIFLKLPKKKILSLLSGFGFTLLGLSLFLCATSAVMTPIGNKVGLALGLNENWIIILVAFIIGLVTILCEPAVHVLTGQMEDISDGSIKKGTVLLTLSIGVGIAIALATIRTIYGFSILWYMIPGYMISLLLMFACPDIFTAMAFDSGGTASGPMSSSFVLPMIAGVATASGLNNAECFERAFGVIALIALTPVIAIQILGVTQNIKRYSRLRLMRRGLSDIKDAQIIHFN